METMENRINAKNKPSCGKYKKSKGFFFESFHERKHSMKLLKVNLIAILFFLITTKGFAEPVITNAQSSGAYDHGTNVTATGQSFGTKATAAPYIWDNGEDRDWETLW